MISLSRPPGRVDFSFYNTIFVFTVKVAKGNDKLAVVKYRPFCSPDLKTNYPLPTETAPGYEKNQILLQYAYAP
ncbi:MAG TPA: hypothetical protein VFU29_08325, partial [Chitinophagaceae bacterium]|nr:hypothetical protein [Chitinophagaceae bacterium]